MSDFVEKVTLDLTGTAVDGTAAVGLGNTSEGVKGLLGDLNKLGESTSAEATIGKLGASLAKLAAGVVGFEAIKGLITDIYNTTKAHEDLTLTIAATMASTNGWSASMGIATGVLKKLQETAVLVNSSEGQMVDTFAMLKRNFGGTEEQAVSLTQKLALLARQAGTTADALAERLVMAANSGTLMGRGPAGIALKPLIDPAELQTMQQAGQAMEYLNAKIAGNPELVAELKNTWSYLTAEWANSKEEAKALIGEGFEPLKGALRDMIANLNSAETKASISNFSAQIRGLTQDLFDLASAGKASDFKIPPFTDTVLTPILKGARVALAELVLLATEINVVVQYTWDVITNPIKYALDGPGSVARLKQMLADTVKAYKDNAAQIAAIQAPAEMAASHGPGKPTPAALGGDTSAADLAAQARDAIQKVNAEIVKGQGEIQILRETGIAKIEDTIKAASANEIEQNKIKYAELIKAHVSANDAQALLDQLNANTHTKETLALADADKKYWDEVHKKLADAQVSIRETWDKVAALTAGGMAGREALIDAGLKKELDAYIKAGNVVDDIEAKGLALAAEGIARKDALHVKADALFLSEQTDLSDRLGEITDDYYLKEQNAIDKSINAQAKAFERQKIAGELTQAQYDALIVGLGKLSAAETAHLALEQNSIIGFRKKMEEEAALLVKTTDSVAGGVAAGMATIAASVKSTTEITRDYVVGIYGALSTGLGSVLKTLETGTGTIKDTLKGILNSLLDSFNTMVVEMVKRWLLGKDQMAAGGGLESLFGGQKSTIDANGNVKFPVGWSSSQVDGGAVVGGPQQRGSTTGATVAGIAGTAAAGYGIGSVVGGASGAPGWATGATVGGVIGTVIFPGLGTAIGAILGAIIGGLIGVLTVANTEKYIHGTDLVAQSKQVGDAIQGGLLDVFASSMLPDKAGFAKSLNDRIKPYLEKAKLFEINAGSPEDLAADVKTLLSGVIPTELLHTLIGQQRTGGQDMAGIGGASKYGGMLDPTAPINKMLTDLGFTADKVQELAGQIDSMAPEEWMKMLGALVGVVAAAGTLGKELSKSYAETIAGIDAEAAKSPAGKLADRLTGVTDLLKAVSFYSGTEQITKGQEAIAAAQQFYNDAKTAMAQLSAMAKQVTQDVADSTKKVLDSLKTPGELAAQSFSDLQHDYDRMRFAANPEDMAAAWAQARTDFEAVAGEFVSRIKQIQTLLDDIHTLQAAIANGPGPNATTDPGAWLAKNTADMEKYRIAMDAATPGSPEQIAAATSFAGLIRDRYQMEIDLLGRVKSTIESIDQSIGASLLDLQMQGMGSVVNGKWTPDTHAQGDFMMSQVTALQGQLAGAQTPEEVQRIVSQIQTLVGKLGAQQQDPTHYAESLRILAQILKDTQKAADARLKDMGAAAQFDISTLGPKLAAAETLMAAALTKVQTDLDALIWHFKRAGEFMTGKLNDWGVEIAAQLNALGPILATMVTNFTDVNDALTGTGTPGGPGGGKPGFTPVLVDATVAVGDFAARLRGTGAPGATGANSTAGGPPSGNVTLTINVDVTSGSPEEVSAAVGAAVQARVLPLLKSSNTELVRQLRNNPQVLARAS
jgi:hypothetical protein